MSEKIIRWRVPGYATSESDIQRREFDRESDCYYFTNGRGREAKQTSYYTYHLDEAEALDAVRAQMKAQADDRAVRQIKVAAVELLEALEKSTHQMHTPVDCDPCACGQCLFVLARDRAIAKARGVKCQP